MSTGCVHSILEALCAILMTSVKLTAMNIFNGLQNLNFRENSKFVYQVGLKLAEPNTGKRLNTNIILMQIF